VTAPEPGPLAEELSRLITAAQDWLHRAVADPATARIATGDPECCWCPICQLIATIRGERPDLLARLAESQAALAGLFRAVVDTAGTAGAAGRPAPPQPDPTRVHPIVLDEDEAAGQPGAGGSPVPGGSPEPAGDR
jgi:hypothetical protein